MLQKTSLYIIRLVIMDKMEVKENVSFSAAFILSVAILPMAVHDILAK